jgi:hypothetical protein
MDSKKVVETLKDWKQVIVLIGSIIALFFAGVFWVQDTLFEREQVIIDRYSELLSDELTEKITESINPMSRDEAIQLFDSMFYYQKKYAQINKLMHMRTLSLLDTTQIMVEENVQKLSSVAKKLDTIEMKTNGISGSVKKSTELMINQAYTDSLLQVLTLAKMKEYHRQRMHQSKLQHEKALDNIEELMDVRDKKPSKKSKFGGRRGQKKFW